MKIHKINLENYYINAFYLAACRKFHAPDSCFPAKPEYIDVSIKVKPGEKAIVALPVPTADVRFVHSNVTAPVWLAPYMPKTGIMYTLLMSQGGFTPSITGVEFRTGTIPLGKLELYENTRWQGQVLYAQTGKLADLQPGNTYTVTLTGRIGAYVSMKVNGRIKNVWEEYATFNNTPIMKIKVEEDRDNGPDTVMDIEEASITTNNG